jgi:transketolase
VHFNDDCRLIFCSHYRQNIDRGKQAEAEWNRALERYQQDYPKEAQALNDLVNQRLSATWEDAIPVRNKASFHFDAFLWKFMA